MDIASLRSTALCSLSVLSTVGASPLLPGKKLGVDYGPTLTPNWNNFTANGTQEAGTVLHLDGSISDGVSMTVANGQFFNNDGTNNWVGLQSNPASIAPNPKAPPEFVDSVTTDIAGNFNLGDGTPFKLTVAGLNPWLSYKVDAVSAAAGSQIDTITIIGESTYPASAITRSAAVSTGLFHHFESVVPTGSGDLVVDAVDAGPGTNPIVNGVLIEASSPSVAGLLDNDSDGMANWWEFAYHFNPADNSDATADADGDGFSNATEHTAGTDPRNNLSVPAPTRWAVNGDGAWGTAGNWNPATVPNGVDKVARLSSSALSSATGAAIAVNLPVTLGSLEVEGEKPFTLGAANSITFNATGATAVLKSNASAGESLTFLGGVVLASPLEVTVADASVITLGGSLSDNAGAGTLTKNGSGDLVLAGNTDSFTGNVIIGAGRVVLDQSGNRSFAPSVEGGGSLLIKGGGTLSLDGANTSSGGVHVIEESTLITNTASALGSGPIVLDGGTLRATESVIATGQILNVGPQGGTVDVTDEFFLLATGGSAASTGAMRKTGPGTWSITGGNAGTLGTLTIEEGYFDLARNDAFGNHTNSQQDLVIAAGSRVTNGSGNTGFNTFRSVTMEGGELVVTNSLSAVTGAFQSYSIKESLVATGTVPSIVTDEVNGPNGAINIGGTADLGDGRGSDLIVAVDDVTSNSAADLTISAKLKNSAGPNFGALRTGLVKEGDGTLLLGGLNAYTGDTSVNQGVLSIQEASLAPVADVKVAEGAILHLGFTGSNTIDQLSLGGVGMEAGEYGAVGSAAPVIGTPFITGSGSLLVSGSPGGDPFADWIAANYPELSAPDNEPDADPDGDGVPNFEEFAFAGNPASGAASGLRSFAIESFGATRHLMLTLACRTGADFAGAGPMTGSADGVNYTIGASADLAEFGLAIELIPPVPAGLPETPPEGFSYYSFRLTVPVTASSKTFLHATATAVP